MRVWAFLTLVAGLFATPVFAHPHVFIDAGVEVIFDADGRASALRITWSYDELYSLSIITDRGFDPDGDGVLTADEKKALSGFDMKWDADFAGDTYALQGDEPLMLSDPADWTADYADGKLISTHVRTLEAPLDLGSVPLVVQAYDPSFYVAYRIVGTPVLTGNAACTAQVFEPDMAAADAILAAAMEELNGSDDPEQGFPAVGAAYADEVRVTCAAPS